MPKLAGLSERVHVPLYDGTPILAARLKSERLRKTKQGVRDLDAALSNGMRGGYNGSRSASCLHAKNPQSVASHVVETMAIDSLGFPKRMVHCSSCGAELGEDRE
jgi:hypothetical protein